MHRETDREKNSYFQIDHEEKIPTIGHDGSVFVTKKPTMTGLRYRLKFSKPEENNRPVAYDVVSSEPSFGKALNGYKKAHSISKEEELEHSEKKEEKEGNHNVVFEDRGSSESNELDNGMRLKPPTCQECRKTFPSLKSLYGHLRSHPERGYRGVNRPTIDSNPPADNSPSERALSVYNWSVRAKRGRREVAEMEILTAAQTLLLMSRGLIMINEEKTDQLRDRKRNSTLPEKKIKILESICKSRPAVRKGGYRCSTCNKSFSTHQALGGHRASHNKTRNNSEAEILEGIKENDLIRAGEGVDSNGAVAKAAVAEHRCMICDETFSSGQALGGHKRRHWPGPENRAGPLMVPSAESVRSANHGLVDLDLNKHPESEEEKEL